MRLAADKVFEGQLRMGLYMAQDEREKTLKKLEEFVRDFVRNVLGMELNDE